MKKKKPKRIPRTIQLAPEDNKKLLIMAKQNNHPPAKQARLIIEEALR